MRYKLLENQQKCSNKDMLALGIQHAILKHYMPNNDKLASFYMLGSFSVMHFKIKICFLVCHRALEKFKRF